MLEEFRGASEQLRVALERYFRICSSIQTACLLQGSTLCHIPLEYAQQVDRELELSEAYAATMKQATLALKVVRNHSFSITPIYSLPPEILTRIFHMARDSDPSCMDRIIAVCALWRSVSINTCSLWTRIDYRPGWSDWRYQELLARGECYAIRSGQLPLEVHISVTSELYTRHSHSSSLEDFCRRIAPRTQYLELDLEELHTIQWSDDGVHSVFTTLLSHCKPGMLTRFVITDAERFGFFAPRDDRHVLNLLLQVGLNYRDFEALFTPVKVLHLTGIFPRWRSQAYRDLVDLRLYPAFSRVSDDDEASIPESQLEAILSASPQLCILHFGLLITRQEEDVVSARRRVRLTDLEALQVDAGYSDNFFETTEGILGMIELSSKPLNLSIVNRGSWYDTERVPTETKAFFTRSNVTKLYANDVPWFFELCPSLSNLKFLVLSEQTVGLQPDHATPSDQPNDELQIVYPRLDICFLLNCRSDLSDILLLVQHCQPRTLIMYENSFRQGDSNARVDVEIVERELSVICPDVRITDAYPSWAVYQEFLRDF